MTGLLKKACEISLLCGVEVAVSFTDLKGNLHSYKNSSNLSIKHKKKIFEMKDKIKVNYNTEDYPFERKFLTKKRRAMKKNKSGVLMLEKRKFTPRKNYEEKLKEDLSKFDKILKKDSSSQSTESKEDSCEFQERSPMVNRSLTLRYKPKFKSETFLQASNLSSMSKIIKEVEPVALITSFTKIILNIVYCVFNTPPN